MKADFTRITFDPTKRIARVLMQQGRVQLDADWNEQAAILLRYIQTLAADLIGPSAGPVHHLGFVIQPFPAGLPGPGNFLISPGRYYVDGVLCENDLTWVPVAPVAGKPKQIQVAAWTVDGIEFADGQPLELRNPAKPTTMVASVTDIEQATNTLTLDQDVSAFAPTSLRRFSTYLTQRDLPGAVALTDGTYAVYLDAWERLITYVEDDSFREVALNGSDTAARSRIVAQVKVLTPGPAPAADPTTSLTPANRGLLRAKAPQTTVSSDPCIVSPDSRYRGPENQLYRVEIHTGSFDGAGKATKPTFKWSRENGAVVFPIVRSTGTNSFVLESLGRDDRFGLVEGDWVEIQDDDSVLLNRAENLLVVQSIERPSLTVTLTGTPSSNTGKDPSKHPLLRRWDEQFGDASEGGIEKGDDNAALLIEATGDDFTELENGIQIQFVTTPPGEPDAHYLTGDYWLIPARTSTGDVEWPNEAATDAQGNVFQSPIALPPQGITHHYALLADINVAGGAVTVTTPHTKTLPEQAP